MYTTTNKRENSSAFLPLDGVKSGKTVVVGTLGLYGW